MEGEGGNWSEKGQEENKQAREEGGLMPRTLIKICTIMHRCQTGVWMLFSTIYYLRIVGYHTPQQLLTDATEVVHVIFSPLQHMQNITEALSIMQSCKLARCPPAIPFLLPVRSQVSCRLHIFPATYAALPEDPTVLPGQMRYVYENSSQLLISVISFFPSLLKAHDHMSVEIIKWTGVSDLLSTSFTSVRLEQHTLQPECSRSRQR